MIEFAKITGDMEGHRIEVQMPTGEHLYAPLLVCGTTTTIPTQEWIDNNKDNFLAVITYEGSRCYDPMVLGFYPVIGADSTSYNTTDRTYKMLVKLVAQLLVAKVNTQLGPQPFMTDTIKVLNEIKDELEEVGKLMMDLKVEGNAT